MQILNFILMGAPPADGGSNTSFFLMMASVMVVFYLFMIRPQMKKQKEATKFRDSISKGNKIVTIGGIHGKIETVKEKTVIITTEGGGKLKIEKSAISPNSSVSELDMQQKA